MIEGHLNSEGIRLRRSRERIWHSLRRIDPVGTSLRWNTAIVRRVYSVPGKHVCKCSVKVALGIFFYHITEVSTPPIFPIIPTFLLASYIFCILEKLL